MINKAPPFKDLNIRLGSLLYSLFNTPFYYIVASVLFSIIPMFPIILLIMGRGFMNHGFGLGFFRLSFGWNPPSLEPLGPVHLAFPKGPSTQ